MSATSLRFTAGRSWVSRRCCSRRSSCCHQLPHERKHGRAQVLAPARRSLAVVGWLAYSTAGNATLTANNGGFIQFFDTSSGGAARVTTNGSGAMVVQLASGGLSIGSLAGSSGSVLFSSQNGGAFTQSLTIGNLNTSTTYGGIISDVDAAASITKIGTGTLTLTATNTFTGPTTINAGRWSWTVRSPTPAM